MVNGRSFDPKLCRLCDPRHIRFKIFRGRLRCPFDGKLPQDAGIIHLAGKCAKIG
jgi:hypothetical protein